MKSECRYCRFSLLCLGRFSIGDLAAVDLFACKYCVRTPFEDVEQSPCGAFRFIHHACTKCLGEISKARYFKMVSWLEYKDKP